MQLRRTAAEGRRVGSVVRGRAFTEELESRRLLAATYFVSPAGNDAASGTSPSTAFKTIARVNALNLEPGDQVLFEGGKTFTLPAGSGAEKAGGAFGSSVGAKTISGSSAQTIRHTLSGMQPGKAYTVKFRVGVDNPTDGRVRGGVWFYDASGNRVGGVAFKLRNSSTFDRSRDFVAPPSFARAEVWVSKEAGSSVVRLSSTSVKETASPLTIDRNDAGTSSAPVVIGSYGSGRATIAAGDATGVSVNDAGGISIRDLNVVGSWNASTASGNNAGSGIEFISTLPNHGKHAYARVQNVNVSGFKWTGVLFEGRVGKAGYDDIRVTDVKTHHNGDSGLNLIRTLEETSSQYAYTDAYIARVEAYENSGMKDKNLPSGSGIVIEDSDRVVVENSVAHHNGRFNPDTTAGPVGFLNANSNAVTIQYNESYSNYSGSGSKDGSGLDLDGGMTNSVLQYNYSHDNAGPGLQTAQYDLARDNWGNNVIRYNVSQNDARRNSYGGLHISGGSELRNLEVYGNTVYMASGGGSDIAAARVKSVGTGVRLRNNLFYTTGGTTLVSMDQKTGPVLQGNAYWAGGSSFRVKAGGSTYSSLSSWRSGTSQERNNGTNTGLFTDPKLSAAGAGGTVGTLGGLSSATLPAYRLTSGSPLINAGQSLTTGGRDFYGTAVPQNGALDIGAAEYTTSTTPTPTPTPSAPEISVNINGGAAVLDGQSTALNFGTVAINATSPQMTFKVANTGTATLNLADLKAPAGFTIAESLAASLAPGASDTFTVRMSTATAGTPYGFVSFTSNDADENPFTFGVVGTVTSSAVPPPATGPVVVRAAADAYVRDGSYASTNFGADAQLQLKKSTTGSNRDVYLKFDLSNVGSISSAKLRLYGKIDSTERPSVAVYATSNNAWTESSLTWNTRPTAGSTALATTTVAGNTYKWYEWDVTAYLKAQKAAGATSVTLVARSMNTTTPHMIFNSDEASSNRPELAVTP